MDELHGQIVTLGLTRTGGPLTAHLQAKMKEISEKVQRNTLEVRLRGGELSVNGFPARSAVGLWKRPTAISD